MVPNTCLLMSTGGVAVEIHKHGRGRIDNVRGGRRPSTRVKLNYMPQLRKEGGAACSCLRVEGHFLLPQSSEQEKEFYSIVSQPAFVNQGLRRSRLECVLKEHGLSPEVLPLPEKGLFLLGFNERVVAIDCR